MSRPMALALVVMILILTSQTEWKQQPEQEQPLPTVPKLQHISSNHQFKEQIILFQEKQIHSLTELVKGLQNQLHMCQESLADNSTGPVPSMQDEVV